MADDRALYDAYDDMLEIHHMLPDEIAEFGRKELPSIPGLREVPAGSLLFTAGPKFRDQFRAIFMGKGTIE